MVAWPLFYRGALIDGWFDVKGLWRRVAPEPLGESLLPWVKWPRSQDLELPSSGDDEAPCGAICKKKKSK
jgi:hypothetical protein